MTKKIDEQRIIDLYQQGNSISQIARLKLASHPTISKILKRNNIAIRKDNGQSLNLPNKDINELYQNGLSTYEIARIYKCSNETIRNLITDVRNYSEANLNRPDSVNRKISKSCTEKWNDPDYAQRVKEGTSSPEYKKMLQEHGKKVFDQTLGLWLASEESRKILSKIARDRWNNPEYRNKQKKHYHWRTKLANEASVKKLKEGPARAQWLEKIRANSMKTRAAHPKTSLQQKQLYYLLNRANIDYYQESADTAISPFYIVDCIIPKQQGLNRDIIIEVQGEYWHSLDNIILRDTQKKTYIENHTDYDLLYLNELDFKNFNVIKRKLNEVGINIDPITCTVNDLTITQITESEARLFFETFHYSSTIRKGATTFGAYYNDQLVAAISYTPPIRLQVARNLKCSLSAIKEISRLAIASDLCCKNTASWFIGHTIKLLPDNIEKIISYSDSTFGHTGTVYKASNFYCDRIIDKNHYYKNEYGEIFHKKTIWDRSKRMNMSVDEYAIKHGLIKVEGLPKKRWIFHRN